MINVKYGKTSIGNKFIRIDVVKDFKQLSPQEVEELFIILTTEFKLLDDPRFKVIMVIKFQPDKIVYRYYTHLVWFNNIDKFIETWYNSILYTGESRGGDSHISTSHYNEYSIFSENYFLICESTLNISKL